MVTAAPSLLTLTPIDLPASASASASADGLARAPATSTTSTPETSTTAASVVQVVPDSIDATGATDVTTELRAFLASVPDGGVARLAKAAMYRVEGTIILRNRHDLALDGFGATFFTTTRLSAQHGHLWIDGGTNVVVRGLTIRGANPNGGTGEDAYDRDLENAGGIRITGTLGVELADDTVTDVFGDFVYVGRAEDRTWSEDVWIHDSRFARNGRQGIAVTAARRVIIEDNRFDQLRRSTIDLEPNTRSSGVEDVFVLDNKVGPGRLRFIASHGGGPVDRVVIARNTLKGQAITVDVKPPDQDRRSGFYVVGNTSDTASGRAPMKFVRVDGLVVRGNVQPVRDRGVGIDLSGVCGVFIAGNTFSAEGPPSTGEAVPDCGTAPDPVLPLVPAHLGRPVGGLPTTTTTGVRPTRPSGPLPSGSTTTSVPGSGGGTDSGGSAPWPWMLGAVILVAAGAVLIRRVRRSTPPPEA